MTGPPPATSGDYALARARNNDIAQQQLEARIKALEDKMQKAYEIFHEIDAILTGLVKS